MRKILWMVLALLIAVAGAAGALELHLATIELLNDAEGETGITPVVDLERCISGLVTTGVVQLRRAELPEGSSVRSLLDATRLCQAQGYGFLLYGHVRRGEQSWSVEMALYDAEKGAAVARFFAADDAAHYDRLMRDLASRIVEWFTADPAWGPAPTEPERNLIAIPLAVGYWTPAEGTWSQVLAGLATVSVGVRYVPLRPLFTLFSSSWHIAFGVDVDYGVGMSQPGYESSILHMVRARLPVEISVDLGADGLLALGVAPLLCVDVLAQDRLYSSFYVGATTVAGMSASLDYRWKATGSLAVGCIVVVDVAFYATPLVTVSPRLFVELTPGRSAKGSAP